MPAPKSILEAADTEGSPFNVTREKAFILFGDLPADEFARLQMRDPAGTWRDISAGSGVRFEEDDFNRLADDPGSLKFFYAAPGQNYRIVVSVAGGVAWLLYGDPIAGLKD